MAKIWLRIGGFITVTEQQKESLLKGDKNALVNAIKHGGFTPVGETYIPANGKDIPKDINFAFYGNE